MFHEGDLQSGIATAIQQNKHVVCFVADDSEQSLKWEREWLADDSESEIFSNTTEEDGSLGTPQLQELLLQKAVLLRIVAGSQEARFLSAFSSISEAPCLLAIYNGQVRLRLGPEVSRESFIASLSAVLEGQPIHASTHSDAEAAALDAHYSNEQQPREADMPTSTLEPRQSTPPELCQASTASTANETQPSERIQQLLHERGARLEAEKKKREEAEKRERIAKGKARRDAVEAAETSSSRSGTAQTSYAAEQAKRKRDARKERERILKQIEDNKLEREEREQRRRALARAEEEQSRVANEESPSKFEKIKAAPGDCAVQVRLLDGSTIRSRFPSSSTLSGDVRPWIDGQRADGDTPYTLKQILTPLPNRTIEVSEEEMSLQDLGLTPTTTLVMVPVQRSVDAYSSGAASLVSRGVSAAYSYASSGVEMLTNVLGTFLGSQPAAAQGPAAPQTARQSNSGSGIKIQTLREQTRARDEQQLYNGNQLNFEPRRSDDDEDG